MGQKVNPIGIRLGITRDWTSRWYASTRAFPSYLLQDWQVRVFLKKKLAEASVSRIHIERTARKANITINTARPGVVIGKKGEDIERLRSEVAKMMGMAVGDVRLNIAEIRKPEVDAQLVAEGIAQQIGIGDEFTVGGEDGCLRGTQTGTRLRLQYLQLLTDGQHGRLQRLAIGNHITRAVMNNKLVTDVPDQRPNRQTGARTNAVNGLRTAPWQPVGGVAPRGQCVAAGAFGIGFLFG